MGMLRDQMIRAMAAPRCPGHHSPQPRPLLLPGRPDKRRLARRTLG